MCIVYYPQSQINLKIIVRKELSVSQCCKKGACEVAPVVVLLLDKVLARKLVIIAPSASAAASSHVMTISV